MASVSSQIIRHPKLCYFSVVRKFTSQVSTKTKICHLNNDVNKLSSLFVPGRRGPHMYQIVKPVIDIDFIAGNLGELKLSCDHRGILLDLDYILQVAKEWLNLRNEYIEVVEQDQKYISELHRLNLSNLKNDIKIVDEKRKANVDLLVAKKEKLYKIEDIVMPLFEKIPHILHSNTPLQFSIIDVYREPPTVHGLRKSHTEIANSHSLLYFMNNSPISYFMTGKLSQLELAIQAYFIDKLNSFGFSPLSCVDFCKSFIIEGIGYDPCSNRDSIQITEKGNRGQKLHLVGGASFEALCTYFTNMNIEKSTLPYKYFSLGRRYNAANKDNTCLDLFSVVQSTNVHSIILTEADTSSVFDNLLDLVIQCYSELNIPYRMVNIAAKNLTIAESHRKQLELWSPALRDYVPVAYLSQHDDFVSKRLQISYGFQYTKEGYCHIVEGALVNIPILIGCIVENFQTKNNDFNIPMILESYFSSIVK